MVDSSVADILNKFDPTLRPVRHWQLSGGLSSDMTAIEVEDPRGQSRKIVVRRPRAGVNWGNPHRIANEFRALTALERAGVPAPRPLYLDPESDDQPSEYMVTSFVEGAAEFSPSDGRTFVDALAVALVDIHRIDSSDDALSLMPDQKTILSGFLGVLPAALDETLEAPRILGVLRDAWPPPLHRKALLHGDYWPGNVLWRDRTVMAIVDWEGCCVGYPSSDVAVMRLNLLWMLGDEAMETFTARYAEYGDAVLDDLPFWDLAAALRPAAGIANWAAGWMAAGRPDITEGIMRARHRKFRAAALDRMAAP